VALLGAFAIAGAPPFGIFLSEFIILSAGVQSGHWGPALVMLVAIALIFMGFVKHFSRMAFGEAPEGVVAGELGRWTVAPTVTLIALAAAIGVYLPPPLVAAIEQIVVIVRGVS
jgi:hydrogenase-4 component F